MILPHLLYQNGKGLDAYSIGEAFLFPLALKPFLTGEQRDMVNTDTALEG